MTEKPVSEIKNDAEALKIINNIVSKTKPIPIECTQKALKNIYVSQFGFDEENAYAYSKNKIIENVFDSLFVLERDKCTGDFAKKSIMIEQMNRTKKDTKEINQNMKI